jgi:SAM-dependent methyltransferase
MSAPPLSNAAPASEYYDAALPYRLRDFLYGNPRVEAAWQAICNLPISPARILEIGCGGGYLAYLMKQRWPAAEVVATDLSPSSIAGATALFGQPGLSYFAGELEVIPKAGYDLVVLVDVIEHVPTADRAAFDAQLRLLLSERADVFMSFPTPAYQACLRRDQPSAMQPVDEDITLDSLADFARGTQTRLVQYAEQHIWQTGDYAHAQFSRSLPVLSATPVSTLTEKLHRRWLQISRWPRRLMWANKIARLLR